MRRMTLTVRITLPALALAVGLAACGNDYERVENAGPDEGAVPEIVPPRSDGAAFDPALDADRDGVLDPEEGMEDGDGDGVRDRDEAYPAAD